MKIQHNGTCQRVTTQPDTSRHASQLHTCHATRHGHDTHGNSGVLCMAPLPLSKRRVPMPKKKHTRKTKPTPTPTHTHTKDIYIEFRCQPIDTKF